MGMQRSCQAPPWALCAWHPAPGGHRTRGASAPELCWVCIRQGGGGVAMVLSGFELSCSRKGINFLLGCGCFLPCSFGAAPSSSRCAPLAPCTEPSPRHRDALDLCSAGSLLLLASAGNFIGCLLTKMEINVIILHRNWQRVW